MKIVIVLLLPLAIVLTVFQFIAFDKNWYEKEFEKLGVYGSLGQEKVLGEMNNVLDYFHGSAELDANFYTKKEMLHLADARELLVRVKWANITIIIILAILGMFIVKKKGLKEFFKNIFLSGFVSLVSFILIILISALMFDTLFYLFHKISFSNDFWLLDPEREFLVVIFPQELFSDIFQRIIFYALMISVSITIASKIFLTKKSQT